MSRKILTKETIKKVRQVRSYKKWELYVALSLPCMKQYVFIDKSSFM